MMFLEFPFFYKNCVKTWALTDYHKVPKYSDARRHCRNLPKIQTQMPNLREFRQKCANGIAKNEDPDLGLNYLSRPICLKI